MWVYGHMTVGGAEQVEMDSKEQTDPEMFAKGKKKSVPWRCFGFKFSDIELKIHPSIIYITCPLTVTVRLEPIQNERRGYSGQVAAIERHPRTSQTKPTTTCVCKGYGVRVLMLHHITSPHRDTKTSPTPWCTWQFAWCPTVQLLYN